MLKFYSAYLCLRCKREVILIKDDIEDSKRQNKFLACPYCSSKQLRLEREEDSLKEIMRARSYRRVRGALRER